MVYPDYPNNRLIVGGIDLTEKFGMILSDGYTLSPPTPKTYLVDIPCGNGKLDLTDSLYGDVSYTNRTQEFTFYVLNPSDFESLKTEISNLIHGKFYDYQLTMDPGYTYHGRFTLKSYDHSMVGVTKLGCFIISVDANPYKDKPKQTFTVSAVGGVICKIPSGRKRVVPTINVVGPVKILVNNKLMNLNTGSWTINDLYLEHGYNDVYLNSFDVRNLTWGNLKNDNTTWGEFKSKHLFEWYISVGEFPPEGSENVQDITFVYDWSDL